MPATDKTTRHLESPTTVETPYDRRIQRVRDAVRAHSELDDKAAYELAVHVLHALDTIPENIR
ncbi:DUF6307 family protein [Nocardia niigatensis]|uniref:DUF6307 family protein n=1 Tax=Nocardia niigatensis TaxID=209249 RepID=UPI00030731D8|nr:DUF6307 family protein [Nocardia niigatensis]